MRASGPGLLLLAPEGLITVPAMQARDDPSVGRDLARDRSDLMLIAEDRDHDGGGHGHSLVG